MKVKKVSKSFTIYSANEKDGYQRYGWKTCTNGVVHLRVDDAQDELARDVGSQSEKGS
jgi:hypothetical protein